MKRLFRLILAASLAIGVVGLGWFGIATLRSNLAKAERAAVASRADSQCRERLRARDAAADAEADFRRGNGTPIVLGYEDPSIPVAPGIGRCAGWEFERLNGARVADFGGCEGLQLHGPHPAIADYAERYNRRMAELAPRQVAAACPATSGRAPR